MRRGSGVFDKRAIVIVKTDFALTIVIVLRSTIRIVIVNTDFPDTIVILEAGYCDGRREDSLLPRFGQDGGQDIRPDRQPLRPAQQEVGQGGHDMLKLRRALDRGHTVYIHESKEAHPLTALHMNRRGKRPGSEVLTTPPLPSFSPSASRPFANDGGLSGVYPPSLPAAPADPSTHPLVELGLVGPFVVPSVGGQRNCSVVGIKA